MALDDRFEKYRGEKLEEFLDDVILNDELKELRKFRLEIDVIGYGYSQLLSMNWNAGLEFVPANIIKPFLGKEIFRIDIHEYHPNDSELEICLRQ